MLSNGSGKKLLSIQVSGNQPPPPPASREACELSDRAGIPHHQYSFRKRGMTRFFVCGVFRGSTRKKAHTLGKLSNHLILLKSLFDNINHHLFICLLFPDKGQGEKRKFSILELKKRVPCRFHCLFVCLSHL